jgi:hypothetical protein
MLNVIKRCTSFNIPVVQVAVEKIRTSCRNVGAILETEAHLYERADCVFERSLTMT